MTRFRAIARGTVVIGALTVASGPAQENVMRPPTAPSPVVAGAHFVAPGAIDYAAILPAPPAPGSLAAVAELETLLNVQAARTAADVAWARLVEKDDVFHHATLFGPWFTKENLPELGALFERLNADLRAIDPAMKRPFGRERPWRADARVQPCVQRPASGSYPSGSAMQAHVWAAVLAELWPERRAELFARAQRAAWGRVLGGVHYPSDLTGGRIVAEAVAVELKRSAVFRTALERCREEAAAAAKKGD